MKKQFSLVEQFALFFGFVFAIAASWVRLFFETKSVFWQSQHPEVYYLSLGLGALCAACFIVGTIRRAFHLSDYGVRAFFQLPVQARLYVSEFITYVSAFAFIGFLVCLQFGFFDEWVRYMGAVIFGSSTILWFVYMLVLKRQ